MKVAIGLDALRQTIDLGGETEKVDAVGCGLDRLGHRGNFSYVACRSDDIDLK